MLSKTSFSNFFSYSPHQLQSCHNFLPYFNFQCSFLSLPPAFLNSLHLTRDFSYPNIFLVFSSFLLLFLHNCNVVYKAERPDLQHSLPRIFLIGIIFTSWEHFSHFLSSSTKTSSFLTSTPKLHHNSLLLHLFLRNFGNHGVWLPNLILVVLFRFYWLLTLLLPLYFNQFSHSVSSTLSATCLQPPSLTSLFFHSIFSFSFPNLFLVLSSSFLLCTTKLFIYFLYIHNSFFVS